MAMSMSIAKAAKASWSAKLTTPLKANHARAPCIYINDPSRANDGVIKSLAHRMPNAVVEAALDGSVPMGFLANNKASNPMDTALYIFKDHEQDNKVAAKTARAYHADAIRSGCNFVSIQLTGITAPSTGENVQWGVNHREFNLEDMDPDEMSGKIYRWLFQVVTVPERLHLIPEEDMLAVDEVNFPRHVYCPLNAMPEQAKDAKVQNVVLILNKPQVKPGRRAEWKVMDRTGEGSYYYRHRGAESHVTWDWIMQLKAGDRVALARMPMVRIKESKRAMLLKAPLRVAGAGVMGAGLMLSDAGKAFVWLGSKMHMGPRGGKWVNKDDLEDELKRADQKNKSKKSKAQVGHAKPEQKEAVVTTEKDEKFPWRDEDNDASTTAGSVVDLNEKADY